MVAKIQKVQVPRIKARVKSKSRVSFSWTNIEVKLTLWLNLKCSLFSKLSVSACPDYITTSWQGDNRMFVFFLSLGRWSNGIPLVGLILTDFLLKKVQAQKKKSKSKNTSVQVHVLQNLNVKSRNPALKLKDQPFEYSLEKTPKPKHFQKSLK